MIDLGQFIISLIKDQLPKIESQARWQEIFEEMAVHTRKAKPEKLLLKRRPNETPEILKYRLENYEPITYGSMNRALDECSRIISGVTVTIQGISDKLQQYIKTEKFDGVPFDIFMQQNAFKRGIEDPNGLLISLPGGDGVATDSQPVKPYPYFVYCYDIRYMSDDIIAVLAEEKSNLTLSNGAIVNEGIVYYLLTKDTFYKVQQTGPQSKPGWQLVTVYSHNMGHIPFVVFRGDYCSDGYYESFFAPYNAFGNEAIRQFSDSQAVHVMSAFPIREEFYAECTWKEVEKTNNPIDENEEKYSEKSELRPMARSPHEVIIREIPPGNTEASIFKAQLPADVPSIRFIHPGVDTVKYTAEAWKGLIELAEKSLNLTTSAYYRSEGQQKMDESPRLSMIAKIGNNFYDNIYVQTLRYWEAYINKSRYNDLLHVVKPSVFDLKTEKDIIEEISTMNEKNAPSVFISELTKSLAKKQFSGNLVSQKIFQVITMFDPYYIYTPEQKENFILTGTADKTIIQKSLVMPAMLEAINYRITAEKFIASTPEAIFAIFEKDFQKQFMKTTPGTLPLVDENGNPIDTPMDVEAEAKANLKGTVGGVQGILGIQESVSKGITSYEAGIAMLEEIYGYTNEVAKRILGEPKKAITSTPPAPIE